MFNEKTKAEVNKGVEFILNANHDTLKLRGLQLVMDANNGVENKVRLNNLYYSILYEHAFEKLSKKEVASYTYAYLYFLNQQAYLKSVAKEWTTSNLAYLKAMYLANSLGEYEEVSYVLFGLGTIPLMTSAIYLGKFLNSTIKQRIQKAIPVFVVIIGLLFIIRGLGLGIPYLSPAPITEIASGYIECH